MENCVATTASLLRDTLRHIELEYALCNDPSLIYPLIASLRRRLVAFDLCDATDEMRISIALEEALENALYHGNLELTSTELQQLNEELATDGISKIVRDRLRQLPFNIRRIHVRVRISHDEAVFIIRDEGRGFEVDRFTPLVIDDEIARPANRGVALMHSFMDAVFYNEAGNEVTLVKRRRAA